jgi:hypothetical protein
MVSNAVFSTATIGSKSALKVSYNVTDGGVLDADGMAGQYR